jgi:hypothetical protein
MYVPHASMMTHMSKTADMAHSLVEHVCFMTTHNHKLQKKTKKLLEKSAFGKP